jgi:membrane protein
VPQPLRRGLARVAQWLFELDESRLSPLRRGIVFTLRLAWLTVRGFFREQLQMRAMALAFATTLAFVPAAALAFAIADAAGATDLLIEETVQPFLAQTFGAADDPSLPGGVRSLRTTLDGLLALVRSTRVEGLGILGFAIVLIALFRVLGGVEEAFAHVFEHRGPPRPLWRRLRGFAVVATATPIGLTYALTSAALAHGAIGSWLEWAIPFAPVRDVLLLVLPPIVVTLTLFLLYVELPDAEVRPRSALLGAFLAALGWYGLQLLHIRFQVGLARYNALYSGFGAFPILLLSIHFSWVIILLGAQVIAAHQNAPTLRQLARGSPRDHAERQAVAMSAAIALAKSGEPIGLRKLAIDLGVGAGWLREVLDDLAAHGIVKASVDRTDRRYTLAMDPQALRAATVLDALERAPGAPDLPWSLAEGTVGEILLARRAAASSTADRTIAELAAAEASATAED